MVRAHDRVILVVLSLVFLILSLLAFALVWGWNPAEQVFHWLDYMARFDGKKPMAAGIVLLLLSLYIFRLAIRDMGSAPPLVWESEFGQVHISMSALESLIQRSAQDVAGVQDVETKVRARSEGVGILLSLKVLPDVSIPAAVEAVQARVKDYLKQTTGLDIADIQVKVKSLVREKKLRVE